MRIVFLIVVNNIIYIFIVDDFFIFHKVFIFDFKKKKKEKVSPFNMKKVQDCGPF